MSQCPSSTALPRLTTRQFAKAQTYNRDVCTNYMEACVPWETQCCYGMSCTNLARGYCLYPLEKCFCQKTSFDTY
ncbi:hypothetical protein RRG08_009067 [Elysia crispata]|uniref:Uncharacterized protein n=1 Tax=Elysia crispata TaxID=231223 RepID=A0AAE1DA20_9GAST|nr:hypothetical protein RRG08_009067 [Elysia crispata]